jgi:NADPH:quinone reductase
MSQADWEPLVKQWFPHLTDTRLRQVTWREFDKHREYIAEMLRADVTKATIHQRLRDEHAVVDLRLQPRLRIRAQHRDPLPHRIPATTHCNANDHGGKRHCLPARPCLGSTASATRHGPGSTDQQRPAEPGRSGTESGMRGVGYRTTGDIAVLESIDLEAVDPGPGEVRVAIVASGVNPTDWKSRNGAIHMPIPPGRHQVAGLDGAGVVDAVGPGVDRVRVGQRVWVQLVAFKRLQGTLQEYVTIPQELVSELPDGVPFDLGGALGVPFVTAHRALTLRAGGPDRLTPGALAGTTILAAGGAGAVGNATIQLGRWAGATVITTVSGPEKAELAHAAGAHHVIGYQREYAAAEIRRISPDGVDIIVEVSPAQNAELDCAVAANGADITVYANNGGDSFSTPVRSMMSLNLSWHYILLYTFPPHTWLTAAADINAALADGAIRGGPEAGLPFHHFPLTDVAQAHLAVQNGAIGKVIVDVQPHKADD